MSIFPYKWTLKDAVFTKDKGTVFSCFACGGGSTMGYKLAGFDVLGCNEIDPRMMRAYVANHNPKHTYLEAIQTLKLKKDLPKELYELDILDGSPPCSSFSMVGNREKDWGKEKKFKEGQSKQVLDTLFFDFIDLAKELRPKVVIAENVKGLLQGRAKIYVERIYKEFDNAGYYVQHFLLDASKMGVPQRRERVFFVALRKDLTNDKPFLKLDFNEPQILFEEIFAQDEARKEIHECIKDAYEYCIANNIADFGKYFEAVHNKRAHFSVRMIYKDKVVDTITADCKHIIAGTRGRINDTELKLAGSFPLDYNFCGNRVGYIVGMSVPPVMMAQIANQIYLQWLSEI